MCLKVAILRADLGAKIDVYFTFQEKEVCMREFNNYPVSKHLASKNESRFCCFYIILRYHGGVEPPHFSQKNEHINCYIENLTYLS